MSFNVNRASQEIDIQQPSDGVVGDVFDLDFTISSGLEATIQSQTGRTSISGNQITLELPGEETIVVIQGGNENYFSAQEAVSFCISPSRPVINESGGQLFVDIAADAIEWYLDEELIATLSPQELLEISVPGSYTARGIATNCPDGEFSEPFNYALGLHEREISIFPNPVEDFIHFSSKDAFRVSIFSIDGKKAMEANANEKLDISELQAGQYIIRLFSNNSLVTTGKIIKIN